MALQSEFEKLHKGDIPPGLLYMHAYVYVLIWFTNIYWLFFILFFYSQFEIEMFILSADEPLSEK